MRRDESINQYLDIADEKRMLSEIAAKNFEENRLFFNPDELIDQIQEFGEGDANTPPTFNASKILETILIDQGLFVEQVSGSYSFSHLTFQEYLTANYIVGDPRSIQALVSEHLYDEQWREVFLLTAGRMREADALLMAMEAEAAQAINTDKLKALFRWAQRITDPIDKQYDGSTKRLFSIHQFFSLWVLNTIREDRNRNLDRDLYPYRDLHSDFYLNLYLSLDLWDDLYRDLWDDLEFCFALYRYLDQDYGLYLHHSHDLCFDFYSYIDPNFYVCVSSEFADRFERELDTRVALVKRTEAAKIFKDVNLQQLVRRFKTQQEFTKATREGKTVELPKESIYDTWLSVLQITDEMLSMSGEEFANYFWYLHAVKLIVDCKEAAGRVSPEVWNSIEERFFTWDALENEA